MTPREGPAESLVTEQRKADVPIIDGLRRLLADTYGLYMQTHNYHWNVTGPNFPQLHDLLEEQYMDIWKATDVIAERIRAEDAHAPGSYREFAELTRLRDDPEPGDWQAMLRHLIKGHEAVIQTANEVAELAENQGDQATLDVATERLRAHGKMRWMLRATLG